MYFQVEGDPHPWPREDNVGISSCAVIVVDMQNDYCSPGCYMDRAGYDLRRLRAPIEPIQRILAAARRANMSVLYTRHASLAASHRSERSTRPAVRGEEGWQIVPELSPRADDVVIDKTTISAFASGNLDQSLRSRSITHLAFSGNTIDVCVHSTLRSAVDLGYQCLLLEDCCGAVNESLHTWAVESIKVEDGVFGTVASSRAFVKALSE